MKPDRIIVGCAPDDELARSELERVYHPVTLSGSCIIWMDPASAELTKYVANTMLAMRISFMNEVASLCDVVGANIHSVRRGVGSDHRIGSRFLYAGPGYGGSCFPKDVKAFVQTGLEHGVEMELAASTDRVNKRQKRVVFRKLKQVLDNDLRGKRVAIWGVAFKPKTDDARESPALTLINDLVQEAASVIVHDPEANRDSLGAHGDKVSWADDAYIATQGADALCLMTEWRQYQNPDFERLKSLMSGNVLIDGRNIWTSYSLAKQGFRYIGIGVSSVRF